MEFWFVRAVCKYLKCFTPNSFSASQEIPRILCNPKVNSCSQEHVTCTYPEPVKSSPHLRILIFWRSILILSSHQRLVLPSGLFSSWFLTNTLYESLLSPIHATCPYPSHALFAHPINTCWPAHFMKLFSILILYILYLFNYVLLCSIMFSSVLLCSIICNWTLPPWS